jgi:hypothetical protein
MGGKPLDSSKGEAAKCIIKNDIRDIRESKRD